MQERVCTRCAAPYTDSALVGPTLYLCPKCLAAAQCSLCQLLETHAVCDTCKCSQCKHCAAIAPGFQEPTWICRSCRGVALELEILGQLARNLSEKKKMVEKTREEMDAVVVPPKTPGAVDFDLDQLRRLIKTGNLNNKDVLATGKRICQGLIDFQEAQEKRAKLEKDFNRLVGEHGEAEKEFIKQLG